jgi:hypothetical protein
VSSLEGEPEIFTANFLATVTGLVAAVQAAEADLEQTGGAVLVTGGGLSLENDGSTGVAVSWCVCAHVCAWGAVRLIA